MKVPDRTSHLVCVDTHVHVHEDFYLPVLLETAAEHFRRAAVSNSRVLADHGVLCLVRPEPGDCYERIRRKEPSLRGTPWRVRAGSEGGALVACRSDGRSISFVAGRQIRTSESLEVLSLGTTAPISHNRSLFDTLQEVLSAGGTPVIPWGFGKWWLRRGRAVREVLRSPLASSILLGDNAGRLLAGPHLPILREARRRGIPVIAGSDPLPLPGHERRAGSYGCLLPADSAVPLSARWLRSMLRALSEQPPVYGSLVSPLAAVTDQLRLRLRARRV